MWQLEHKDRQILIALDSFLESEQGTIDTILVLARYGLGKSAFAQLAEIYEGNLELWQLEELSEALASLLGAVERMVDEEFEDDWESNTKAKYLLLTERCRELESRIESYVECA